MNNTVNVFAMLLVATLLFHGALNYMTDNIGDFETVALPPKKPENLALNNPVINVDATSRDSWTLVDFADGKTYRVKDPELDKEKMSQLQWDLGFQRTKIIANGGATNPAGEVGVIDMGKVDIDDVREAPETGYVQDNRAWGKLANPSLRDWYLYRTRTHNIESQRNVYVVRTANGRHMKFRIVNYYCGRKESDCASIMCSREEAACLTIEYVLSSIGERMFPASPSSVTAANLNQNLN